LNKALLVSQEGLYSVKLAS